jgi:Flp pilus assembly protein CpaB
LVLAIICTLAIKANATRKYASAARTVKVVQATEFIPAGEQIDAGMVKDVDVPAQVAQNLETDFPAIAGKSARVSILQGQYLMQGDVDTQGRDPGTVEVYVPVTVPSSACVLPGEYVDVYQKGNNNGSATLLVAKAKVLHTVDSSAKQTEPGKSAGPTAAMGSSTVAAVGIEVPGAQAAAVVSAASQNEVYLALSAV